MDSIKLKQAELACLAGRACSSSPAGDSYTSLSDVSQFCFPLAHPSSALRNSHHIHGKKAGRKGRTSYTLVVCCNFLTTPESSRSLSGVGHMHLPLLLSVKTVLRLLGFSGRITICPEHSLHPRLLKSTVSFVNSATGSAWLQICSQNSRVGRGFVSLELHH